MGFGFALATYRVTQKLRGSVIFVTLLPTIVKSAVLSIAVYLLFNNWGVIAAALSALGSSKFYFLADQLLIRLIIIAYSVWFAGRFASTILCAGLKTVPEEPIEAAIMDGAAQWQKIAKLLIHTCHCSSP